MKERDKNTELPWYLQQILENNDDDTLTASYNSFPTADVHQRSKRIEKPCSSYEGDFIPSRGSVVQHTAETINNMKQDAACRTRINNNNSQRKENTSEPEQVNQRKPQRKRSRFQSDIFEGEGNDANSFEFKPFTGSMEELVAQQKHFNTNIQLSPSLQYSDPYSWVFWMQWQYLMLLLCWMVTVWIPIYRQLRKKKYDGTLNDAAPSLSGAFSEGEKGAKDEHMNGSMIIAARNKSGNEAVHAQAILNIFSDSQVPANEYADAKSDEMVMAKNNEKTVDSGFNAMPSESIFTKDIPAMAQVISLTGLSRQDSIRIATQEVLAAQRRHMEQELKMERERVDRSKLKADQGEYHSFLDILNFICAYLLVASLLPRRPISLRSFTLS